MAIVRPHSVLPDANIWCSATLHSWFGLIATETIGSWTFHWTEDILAEAVYHRRKRFPRASSQQIEALRDRLMASMGENRISRFPIDESVTYPDEYDAHVHSAAIHEGIAIIVTNDRTGFTGLYPDPDECPYEVHTADEFLTLVADSAPPRWSTPSSPPSSSTGPAKATASPCPTSSGKPRRPTSPSTSEPDYKRSPCLARPRSGAELLRWLKRRSSRSRAPSDGYQ